MASVKFSSSEGTGNSNEETTSDPSSDSETQTMKAEVAAAVSWWSREIRRKCLNMILVRRFQTALTKQLFRKLRKHWWPDEPERGSAYRSISFFHQLDPVLKRAAEHVGMHRPENLLESAYEHIMFLNPGRVVVKRKSRLVQQIYPLQKAGRPEPTPPLRERPKARVEPKPRPQRKRPDKRSRPKKRSTKQDRRPPHDVAGGFGMSSFVNRKAETSQPGPRRDKNGATPHRATSHSTGRVSSNPQRSNKLSASAKPFGGHSPGPPVKRIPPQPNKHLSINAPSFQPSTGQPTVPPNPGIGNGQPPAGAGWTDGSAQQRLQNGGMSFVNGNNYSQYSAFQ